jgi:hypothetical protein
MACRGGARRDRVDGKDVFEIPAQPGDNVSPVHVDVEAIIDLAGVPIVERVPSGSRARACFVRQEVPAITT